MKRRLKKTFGIVTDSIAFHFILAIFLSIVLGWGSLEVGNALSPQTGVPNTAVAPIIAGIFAVLVAVLQLRPNNKHKVQELQLKQSQVELEIKDKIYSIQQEQQTKEMEQLQTNRKKLEEQNSLLAKLDSLRLELEVLSFEESKIKTDGLIIAYKETLEQQWEEISKALERMILAINQESSIEQRLLQNFALALSTQMDILKGERARCEAQIEASNSLASSKNESYTLELEEIALKQLPDSSDKTSKAKELILIKDVVKWNGWRSRHPQKNVSLASSDLRRVNLSGANLRRVNLSGANLRGVNLSGPDLRRVNLSGADLRCVNLSGADLIGADLFHADLSGANLRRVNLSGADLRHVNLSGADLSDANLSGADLSDANLSGANLSGANLEKAKGCTEKQLASSKLLCKTLLPDGTNLDGNRDCERTLSSTY